MIRVLFLSSSDSLVGAAKATLKLFQALQKKPLDLQMFVKRKVTNEAAVHPVFTFLPMTIHMVFDNLVLKRYKGANRNAWSLGLLPNWNLLIRLRTTRYDIIQLNWISGGFVPVRLLKYIRRPIVWRLSDSWAFTGGCHIPDGCLKYETGCGACPQLNSTDDSDISRKTINRKQQSWEGLDMTIVAPSKWMAGNARRSSLFRNRKIVHIPTGINTEIFTPLDRGRTREKLGLSADKDIVLFGAFAAVTDPNKGFHLLLKALQHLAIIHPHPESVELAVFGNYGDVSSVDLKFKATFLGIISDSCKLNEYYSAADVYVLPSLMENSPNTVLESMSAGTPVVAFDACGTTEMLDHKKDGYLAQAYVTEDLAEGLLYFLQRKGDAGIRKVARDKIITRYDIDRVADQYKDLYESIVADVNSVDKIR
ncbi:MAG TPA: glycosyltransferase [Chryseolinea sp.]|nr:glycosyltransferase [Chryseolinea sp.]